MSRCPGLGGGRGATSHHLTSQACLFPAPFHSNTVLNPVTKARPRRTLAPHGRSTSPALFLPPVALTPQPHPPACLLACRFITIFVLFIHFMPLGGCIELFFQCKLLASSDVPLEWRVPAGTQHPCYSPLRQPCATVQRNTHARRHLSAICAGLLGLHGCPLCCRG